MRQLLIPDVIDTKFDQLKLLARPWKGTGTPRNFQRGFIVIENIANPISRIEGTEEIENRRKRVTKNDRRWKIEKKIVDNEEILLVSRLNCTRKSNFCSWKSNSACTRVRVYILHAHRLWNARYYKRSETVDWTVALIKEKRKEKGWKNVATGQIS